MDVPIDASSTREVVVNGREEGPRENRRDDGLDGLVKKERPQHLMDVVGESREGKGLGQRLRQLEEEGGWRGDWIEHGWCSR